jgi:hypothetical protein
LDGSRIVKAKASAQPDQLKALGESVAREVLNDGGQDILMEIRNQQLQEAENR